MKFRIFARFALMLVFAIIAGFISTTAARHVMLEEWPLEDSWVVEITQVNQVEPLEGATDAFDTWETTELDLQIRHLSGERKGSSATVRVEHLESSSIKPKPGRNYVLSFNDYEDGNRVYFITDLFRAPILVGILVASVVFFCLVAGGAGIRALLALLFSFVILVKVLLPGLLKGYSPQLLTVAVVAGIALITVVLVLRRKSCWASAFTGALGGCASALFFGWFSVMLLDLSGLSTESGSLLASTLPELELRGILLSSIIIGASGAVLDVAISITSSMAEMKDYNPDMPQADLFQAGLNVGKEILGSMVNTLIFAYFGNSLVLSLLITEAEPVPLALLNNPAVAEEIVRGLAGTAGLLLTIPLAALFGVAFQFRREKKGVAEV
ncbi:MAG: YibE/F family protein [Thermovirgaceae bacterium]